MNSPESKKPPKDQNKTLNHLKNVDFDTFFLEQENNTLAAQRIKTKSTHRLISLSSNVGTMKVSSPTHRDVNALDDIVITKLKAEKVEDFLSTYGIQPSTLGSITYMIGKVVYTFKVHNIKTSFSWTIRRTITEFDKLFKAFKTFLKKEGIQDPGKSKSFEIVMQDGKTNNLTFDYLNCKKTEEASPTEVLSHLDSFISTLIDIQEVKNFIPLFDFIELSCITYPINSKKFKECYLKKKPGGRFRQGLCKTVCKSIFSLWTTRWFMISEDGIKYCMGPGKDKCLIREMLLFDNSLKIEYGFKQTGSIFGINLTTTSRKLILKATSLWELYDSIGAIEDAIKACAYIQENRFSSFAPQRDQLAYCKYYVDGENYYSDLYDSLMMAQSEVFITDWWLSPELYLKRPVNEDGMNQESRLDRVLTKIARKGVKIHIIVYREVSFVLPLDSNHTKSLEKLHFNIKVLQHPPDLICWWSHHEKIVIIDQELAYMGGLDLCFGRMDNPEHRLLDLEGDKGECFWPGVDYSNCRIADFREVKKHEKPLIPRTTPRMPWHDIAMRVLGIPVKDLARHFIQYWNYAKVDLADRSGKYIANRPPRRDKKTFVGTIEKPKPRAPQPRKSTQKIIEVHKIMGDGNSARGRKRGSIMRAEEKVRKETAADWNEECDEFKMTLDLHSKRYTHPENMPHPPSPHLKKAVSDELMKSPTQSVESRKVKKSFTTSGKIGNNFQFKSDLLRPMKSQTLKVEPSAEVNIAIKENFNEIYMSMDKNKQNFVDYEHEIQGYAEAYQQLLKSKGTLVNPEKTKAIRITEHFYEENMLLLKYDECTRFKTLYQNYPMTCKCQIVRSASNWSCGLDVNRYENSIQFAYLQLIEESEHYIYIENQFFISSLAGPSVENNIAKALLYRIKKAHANHENFKVFVVMPLLPGFEGDIADKASSVMRIQLHWEYSTISRSETSLMGSLRNEGINPNEYLIFLGLRTHAKYKKPLTEIVYVHSKLMIVDDSVVIMGSANINDRSMNGNRDSEIGVNNINLTNFY